MRKTCGHDPKTMTGLPIGMYHCPDCDEMVVAGIEHPKFDPSTIPNEPARVGKCLYVEEVEDGGIYGKHFRCYYRGWFYDINKPCYSCMNFKERRT